MSPIVVVVEYMKVTLKPLAVIAAAMVLAMLMPDAGEASTKTPAAADAATPATTPVAPARDDRRSQTSKPVTTSVLVLELDRLPPSAFGDDDDRPH